MTNHERIKQMSVEELAKLLIYKDIQDEGSWEYGYYIEDYQEYYRTPDGGKWQDYEDALAFTIEWLGRERG